MKSLSRALHLLTLLALGVPLAGADAIRLTADDFESYAAGSALPKTGTGTSGSYGYGAGADKILVVTDPANPANRVARLYKEAARGGAYLDAFARRGTVKTFRELAQEGLHMALRHDVYVSGKNENQYYVSWRAISGSEGFGTVYFKRPSGGRSPVHYLVAGGSEEDSGVRVAVDAWHTLTMEFRPLEPSAWSFSASITDKQTGTSVVIADDVATSIDAMDSPSFNRIRFYQFGSPAGESAGYIDRIAVQYEPATVGQEKAQAIEYGPEETIRVPPDEPATPADPEPSDRIRLGERRIITGEESGYVGWPGMAILPSGDLLVVASGGRVAHACPFGACYLYRSADLGDTWEGPTEYWNGKLDDRDNGILVTSKGTVLVNWFTSIAWLYHLESDSESPTVAKMREYGKSITLDDFMKESGYWMMRSLDGGRTWEEKYRVPVASPHGPCELRDGRLLYVGYEQSTPANLIGGRPATGSLAAFVSNDDGRTWTFLSRLPVREEHRSYQYHEPHAVQAEDGSIVVHIRKSYPKTALTLQVISTDGGLSWSEPEEVYWGFPSHLIRLKDGRLLATYGYRRNPIGIRARTSADNGRTWSDELVLYDEAVSGDMGYPNTVELPDGKLFTVWYEWRSATRCVLASLRWEWAQ